MTDQNVNTSTGEMVSAESLLSDDMLSNITSFEDALALVNEHLGGEVVEADKVLGTGFGVADEKSPYIGVPFLIMKADKNPSEKGERGYFYSLHCVTKDGRKVIINDGGSGIAEQLDTLYAKHPEMVGKPMLVRKGLRSSNYTHPVHGPSVTYYLDTSASV